MTTPRFLDINNSTNCIGIYCKDTFCGWYTNLDSFIPWRHKISWIRALVDRIHRICSPNMVKLELKHPKKIISWNGFPSRIAHALICCFSSNTFNKNHTTATTPRTKMSQSPFGFLFHILARKCHNFYVPLNESCIDTWKTLTPRSKFVRKPQNCASTPTTKQIQLSQLHVIIHWQNWQNPSHMNMWTRCNR